MRIFQHRGRQQARAVSSRPAPGIQDSSGTGSLSRRTLWRSRTKSAAAPIRHSHIELSYSSLVAMAASKIEIARLVWNLALYSWPLDVILLVSLDLHLLLPWNPQQILWLAAGAAALSFVLSMQGWIRSLGLRAQSQLEHVRARVINLQKYFAFGLGVLIVLHLVVQVGSAGIIPLVLVGIIAAINLPRWMRDFQSQFPVSQDQRAQSLRRLYAAVDFQFLLLVIGSIAARLVSVFALLAYWSGQTGLNETLALTGSGLLLLIYLRPRASYYMSRCRRCGRFALLPLERHQICYPCYFQRR